MGTKISVQVIDANYCWQQVNKHSQREATPQMTAGYSSRHIEGLPCHKGLSL
jgi:hypothetical protein